MAKMAECRSRAISRLRLYLKLRSALARRLAVRDILAVPLPAQVMASVTVLSGKTPNDRHE
jgi:hypothetical protein